MFRPAWTHPRAHWLSLAATAVGLRVAGVWVDLSPREGSDCFFSEDDPQIQVSLELEQRYPGRTQVMGPVLAVTLLICVGFGIFGLSTFPPTRRFGFAVILGTMAAATMALVTFPLAVEASRRRSAGDSQPA